MAKQSVVAGTPIKEPTVDHDYQGPAPERVLQEAGEVANAVMAVEALLLAIRHATIPDDPNEAIVRCAIDGLSRLIGEVHGKLEWHRCATEVGSPDEQRVAAIEQIFVDAEAAMIAVRHSSIPGDPDRTTWRFALDGALRLIGQGREELQEHQRMLSQACELSSSVRQSA